MSYFIKIIHLVIVFTTPSLIFAQGIETRDSIDVKMDAVYPNVNDMQLIEDYGAESNIMPEYNWHDTYPATVSSRQPDIDNFGISHDNHLGIPFIPYNISMQNPVEGYLIQGAYNRVDIGNIMSLGINVFASRYYNGFFYPSPYINGSAKLEVTLKLHERVQLFGMGQISLREGINPKVPSSFGTANYYGVGIQFKVTNKIGFCIGATNSFYRGQWTKQAFFTPASY